MLAQSSILILVLFALSLGQALTLTIPQIVDGGAWLKTIDVTNTGEG
jgi:hypothetical protein